MGVDDVYEFLKKNSLAYFLPTQIAENLNISANAVRISLKTIVTYDDIKAVYKQKSLLKLHRGGWHYAYVPKKLRGVDGK